MTSQERKKTLNKLIKEATSDQIIEQTLVDVNDADTETPQQFAHRVFQQLIDNIHIEGLDD